MVEVSKEEAALQSSGRALYILDCVANFTTALANEQENTANLLRDIETMNGDVVAEDRNVLAAYLATLQAERDRYRVALEEIEQGVIIQFLPEDQGGIKFNDRSPVQIARTALSDTPTVQS